MTAEQGSGTLAAIMALLFLGLLSLLGWQRALDAHAQAIHDEQRHLTAFHRAESALSWAMTLSWRGDDTPEEECRQPAGGPFQVCLVMAARGRGWVLRAESGGNDGPAGEMVLYRRVALHPDETAAGDPGRRRYVLAPAPRGWLDYDPG